jgi:hypothetical protein
MSKPIQPQYRAGLQHEARFALFDADGLPWTSRFQWGWVLIVSLLTGFVGPILLGVYLGLWLKSKRQSFASLSIYLAVAALSIAACIPIHLLPSPAIADASSMAALILWIAGAFTLRYQVINYFSGREGETFDVDPLRTFVFSVWYIGGCLRPDFPINEEGKTSSGILKLTTWQH